MKKSILFLTAWCLLTLVLLVGCSLPRQDVDSKADLTDPAQAGEILGNEGGLFVVGEAAVSPEALAYEQSLAAFPEELLSGDTQTLLDTFLSSEYAKDRAMRQGIYSTSELAEQYACQAFEEHVAFRELMKREDLLAVLDDYVTSFDAEESSSIEKNVLTCFFKQESVKALITASGDSYPSFQTWLV